MPSLRFFKDPLRVAVLSSGVCLCLMLIGVRTHSPSVVRRVEPIPGQPPHMRRKVVAVMRRRFEELQTDRDQQQEGAAALAETLWQRYAASPQAPDAPAWLCHAGLHFLEHEDHNRARNAFQKVVSAYPETTWEREARLALFDLSVEADLDFEQARLWVHPVCLWASQVSAPERDDRPPLQAAELRTLRSPLAALTIERPGPVLPPLMDGKSPESRPDVVIACDAIVRVAALDFCVGDAASARARFESALRLRSALPAPWGLLAQSLLSRGLSSTAANYYPRLPFSAPRSVQPRPQGEVASTTLQTRPAAGRPSPPMAEASESHSRFAQKLRYTDMLRTGRHANRSLHMLNALLAPGSEQATADERAYALIRRAEARSGLASPIERNPELILEDLDFACRIAVNPFWAGEALLLAGNASWHLARDEARALQYYDRMLTEYGDHRFAAKAAYEIGIRHEIAKRWEPAYLAFHRVQQRYPKSGLTQLVEDHLSKIQPHLPSNFRRPQPPDSTPVALELEPTANELGIAAPQ